LIITHGASIIQDSHNASHIKANQPPEVVVIALIHAYQAHIILQTAAISSSTCETKIL